MELKMDKQRARQLYELADRLSKLDVNTLSEEQLSHRNTMIAKLQEEVKSMSEARGDIGNYYNARRGSEYGKGFTNTSYGGGNLTTKRDDNLKDQSKNLPADPFNRTSGAVPDKSAKGRIHRIARPEEMEEEFNGEYDDEAGMAKSNLHTMARAVNGLLDIIEDNDNLPEWAQEKIAKAEMMTTSVWDYLLSQKEQGMDPKVAEDVTEDNDHSLKKVWDRYSKHLMAARGHHPSVKQINKSGEILQNIRKYVKDHHGQKAVDDMERYAEKRQWSEGIAETKKPSPKLTPVNIKKTDTVSEEINTEAYERLQKVFAFKNYES